MILLLSTFFNFGIRQIVSELLSLKLANLVINMVINWTSADHRMESHTRYENLSSFISLMAP